MISEWRRLLDASIYLFYSQAVEAAAVAGWLAPLQERRGMTMVVVPQLQQAPDLGARMAHALQHALDRGHRRVAIVGTDIPDLTAAHVARALRSLDSHQVVFGPAEDGGYYLLALTALPPGLFEVRCCAHGCAAQRIYCTRICTQACFLLRAGHRVEHAQRAGSQRGLRPAAGHVHSPSRHP